MIASNDRSGGVVESAGVVFTIASHAGKNGANFDSIALVISSFVPRLDGGCTAVQSTQRQALEQCALGLQQDRLLSP